MRAVVIHEAGGPEALQLTDDYPEPEPPVDNDVRIRIKAFGLNRAELFTRQGDSGPAVKFPRVIGIECTGEVIDVAPGMQIWRQGKR